MELERSDESHHDLLGEDIPGSLGRAHGVEKPLTLGLTEERVAGVRSRGVEGTFLVVVRLVGAVLAGIENEEFREGAEASFAVERHVGTDGKRGSAQGHHLVISLVGIGATDEELGGIDILLFGNVVGAVVVEFVIIPSDEPWAGGVHGLEIFVAFVLRVADAVLVERFDFRSQVGADFAISTGGIFVNVVAEVEDEVGLVFDHLLVGREEPGFEVLAGGNGKAELVGGGVGRGHGAGAADGAGGVAGFEAVGIPMIGLKAAGLDVDGVAELGGCVDLAGLDDLLERVVFGDLPMHLDGSLGHAAAGFERLGCETGPEDDAFVVGISRGNAEGKGIAGEDVSRGGRGVAA